MSSECVLSDFILHSEWILIYFWDPAARNDVLAFTKDVCVADSACPPLVCVCLRPSVSICICFFPVVCELVPGHASCSFNTRRKALC